MTAIHGRNKVIEECSELSLELIKDLQHLVNEMGNLGQPYGVPFRYRTSSWQDNVENEMGDVLASITFFIAKNKLNKAKIIARSEEKYDKYKQWAAKGDEL